MKTKLEKLEEIHLSSVNGQRKQMANQIEEYSLYDFFEDYKLYLCDLYIKESSILFYFSDCVISYHRIKNR